MYVCVYVYVCVCVCVYIYILCLYGRLVCILLHNAAQSFETTGSAGGVLPSPVAGAGGGWGGEATMCNPKWYVDSYDLSGAFLGTRLEDQAGI
jgi:hypothetical protein